MKPCHAPDYADIFMNELDRNLVDNCSISLVSSLHDDIDNTLNWSRFRDDGFVIIPNEDDITDFETHLQGLCPGKIKWTLNSGKSLEYLDVKVSIDENGKLKTDIFSKNSHSYLPPNSCHNPSMFKGIARGMGRRLRLICSDDDSLKQRILEYTQHLVDSGWKRGMAKRELELGASIERKECFKVRSSKSQKKVAWVTTYDPRTPNKSKIIKDNLDILYSNLTNIEIFPRNMLISADRRRKNIGEIYKPTIPKIKQNVTTANSNGFHTCKKQCDTCKHSNNRTYIQSKWDSRKWKIRDHIECSAENVIFILLNVSYTKPLCMLLGPQSI